MPISVNTGSGAYSVNASRVEKFMNAEDRDQALHMGAWDKFKDLFRTGDEKKAAQIAKIYDSIVAAESAQDYPVGRAERFKRLRDMASEESKSQFALQASKDDRTGLWSYSFAIGSDRIFERRGLLDTHHDSFESFSNYKQYFDGVDTVAPAPEAITDLNSALKGVLHEMSGPNSEERSVLQALAHVPQQIRTPVTTQDPVEQRAILLANGESQDHVDVLLQQANTDPVGFGLLLSRKPGMSDQGFLGPLEAEINRCVDELPKHQLLAIADFYKVNPYFTDGLHQGDMLTLPKKVDTSGIEPNEVPRHAGALAKAAFIDELGKTAKLIFAAVERVLDGDIYRSYQTNDSSWRVKPNDQPHPSEDLSTVIRDFLCGTDDLANMLAQKAPQQPVQPISGEPIAQQGPSQGPLDPFAVKA